VKIDDELNIRIKCSKIIGIEVKVLREVVRVKCFRHRGLSFGFSLVQVVKFLHHLDELPKLLFV
jgi:hypothetical protein